MPTLLETGRLKEVLLEDKDDFKAGKFNETRAIDYIISFFKNRLYGVGPPLVKTESYGDKVLILESMTASGKSTVLPTYLFNNFYEQLHRTIVVTQPRIFNAMDIPRQIVQFNDNLIIGKNLGYQTGPFKQKGKGLLFSTPGVLLQQLKCMTDDEFSNQYGIVIIDEVHSRSLEVDNFLYLFKKFLQRNYEKMNCPMLILMSATLDRKLLCNYFETKNFISVEGFSYEKHAEYLKYDSADYIQDIANKVVQIHKDGVDDLNDPFRDILVFFQGAGQIKKCIDTLLEMLGKSDNASDNYDKSDKSGKSILSESLLVVSLDSAKFNEGGDDYKNLKLPITKGVRKVVFSTNLSETGLTFDNLKYVIDSGWKTDSENINGITVLSSKPVTMSEMLQRKGRVGRKAPGYWYPMFTAQTESLMIKDKLPDLLTSEVSGVILSVIYQLGIDGLDLRPKPEENTIEAVLRTELNIISVKELLDLDMMSKMTTDSIYGGLNKLYNLGFVQCEGKDVKMTPLGCLANLIRKTSMENIRMLFESFSLNTETPAYNALNADTAYNADIVINVLDVITIIMFLELGNKTPIGREHVRISDLPSEIDDFIYPLVLINEIESSDDPEKYCDENDINYSALLSLIIAREEFIIDLEQIIDAGIRAKFEPLSLKHYMKWKKVGYSDFTHYIDGLKKCIRAGYGANVATHVHDNVYQNDSIQFIVDSQSLPKFEFNSIMEYPPQITYHNIICKTTRKSNNVYKMMASTITF